MNDFDFSAPAPQVARDLLGWELSFNGDVTAAGIIIETEAYTVDDPASHSFRGPTKRNAPMFQAAGTIYIYFIYGMHYCLNFVTGKADGQAVLIRALRPTSGIDAMRARRGAVSFENLANGPAKLVQALGVPANLNGRHISETGLRLSPPIGRVNPKIGTRIGINKAVDKLWRFYVD